MDVVVPHVTHPAQDDALGKAIRSQVVSRSKLPEHGEKRIADQRIDLVDEQHQRPAVGFGPLRQRLLKRPGRAEGFQDAGPRPAQELLAQGAPRPRAQLPQNRSQRSQDVFPHRPARSRRSCTRSDKRPRPRCSAGPAEPAMQRSCPSAAGHAGRSTACPGSASADRRGPVFPAAGRNSGPPQRRVLWC